MRVGVAGYCERPPNNLGLNRLPPTSSSDSSGNGWLGVDNDSNLSDVSGASSPEYICRRFWVLVPGDSPRFLCISISRQ